MSSFNLTLPEHTKTKSRITGAEPPSTSSEHKNIFKKIDRDFANGRFTFMGDVKQFKLVYITMVSSLHAFNSSVTKPVGSFVVGKTSTGKTELMYSAAKLIPKNSQINLTTVSSRSLIYHCMENPSYMDGKVLLVEEMSGIKDLDLQYLLRILVTKGEAVHNTVIGGKAVEIEVNGAISLQSTGLPGDNLRDDTMNRLLKLETDDSSDMTSRVIDHIKERYYSDFSDSSFNDFRDYHVFFQSLSPFKVSIPYVRRIKFDNSSPDCRRKAKIFLDLLSAVALINQENRELNEDGALISREEDFHILHSLLLNDKPTQTFNLKPFEKVVLETFQSLSNKEGFSYDDLIALKPAPKNGSLYDKATIRVAMKSLKEKGLVESFQIGRSVKFNFVGIKPKDSFGVLGLDDL